MSVLLTDMQSVEDELEQNEVSKPDPMEARVEALEEPFTGNDIPSNQGKGDKRCRLV